MLAWSRCTGAASVTCSDLETTTALSLADGDLLGVQVSGSGSSTVVEAWVNPTGASPLQWGAADWASSIDPGAGNYVDSGLGVGLFVNSTAGADRGNFDDFSAGSAP